MCANFDVEFDGIETFQQELESLRDDWDTDAAYATGTNVEYGRYLEMGTEDMPPYPWFRPAIRQARLDFDVFLRSTIGQSTDSAESARQLLWWIAQGLSIQMTRNVNAQKAGFRSPGTHPDHPKRDIGNLTGSIKAVRID